MKGWSRLALAAVAIAAPAAAVPSHRAAHARGVADPRAFVVQVYAAYGRGDSTPGPDVDYSYSDRLRRLFHDYETWERAQNGELVGALNFDWWTNSQEWGISHVVVTQTDPGPDRRFVIARFDNEGRHETNRFEFVRIGGRWYLDDVVNGAGTGDGTSTAPGSTGWTLSALLRGMGARPVF